jgi:hypothetical protein
MPTQCSAQPLEFSSVERRRVVAAFDGGRISSDAGALLLQQADQRLRLLDRLADCFEDRRDADLIEHSVRTLLGQRIFGMVQQWIAAQLIVIVHILIRPSGVVCCRRHHAISEDPPARQRH